MVLIDLALDSEVMVYSFSLISFVIIPTKILCFARVYTQLLFTSLIFIALENFEIHLYLGLQWYFSFYALGNCKTWVVLVLFFTFGIKILVWESTYPNHFHGSSPSHLFFLVQELVLEAIVIVLERFLILKHVSHCPLIHKFQFPLSFLYWFYVWLAEVWITYCLCYEFVVCIW